MQQAQLDLLVMAAQRGNTKAFECLIEYMHPQLLKFAYKIAENEALAKDAVQNAWLTINKKLRHLDDARAFRSWAFRAVRWRTLDMIQHKSYQFNEIDDHTSTVELDESDAERSILLRQLQQLSKNDRTVLHLFYLEEMSLAEVAIVLDLPAGTVKSRLNRARKNFQTQLQDHSSATESQAVRSKP